MFVLDSETLSIVGGEGMNTSATGNTVTVEGEDASTTNKGVASFQSTHFDVTAGAVNIQADAIDDTLIDLGRQFRWSYLPPLMVYIAAGISGLTGIVGIFFVKDIKKLSGSEKVVSVIKIEDNIQ